MRYSESLLHCCTHPRGKGKGTPLPHRHAHKSSLVTPLESHLLRALTHLTPHSSYPLAPCTSLSLTPHWGLTLASRSPLPPLFRHTPSHTHLLEQCMAVQLVHQGVEQAPVLVVRHPPAVVALADRVPAAVPQPCRSHVPGVVHETRTVLPTGCQCGNRGCSPIREHRERRSVTHTGRGSRSVTQPKEGVTGVTGPDPCDPRTHLSAAKGTSLLARTYMRTWRAEMRRSPSSKPAGGTAVQGQAVQGQQYRGQQYMRGR